MYANNWCLNLDIAIVIIINNIFSWIINLVFLVHKCLHDFEDI